MAFNEVTQAEMDQAAGQAKEELQQHFDNWSAQELAAWWIRWYLRAGHKRLGRILVAMGKAHAE